MRCLRRLDYRTPGNGNVLPGARCTALNASRAWTSSPSQIGMWCADSIFGLAVPREAVLEKHTSGMNRLGRACHATRQGRLHPLDPPQLSESPGPVSPTRKRARRLLLAPRASTLGRERDEEPQATRYMYSCCVDAQFRCGVLGDSYARHLISFAHTSRGRG